MFRLFSEEEYKERVSALQRQMTAQEIDLMLLTQKENVEYWTGYTTIHWAIKGFPPAIAAVPPEGKPLLVVPAFLAGTAEKTSCGCHIVSHADTHAFPEQMLGFALEKIRESFANIRRIGVESGHELKGGLSCFEWREVAEFFKGAEFVKAGDVIWGVRMKKSESEIECMATSTATTTAALLYLRRHVKPGWTEFEVSNTAKIEMLQHGGDDIGFINFRSGPSRYRMHDTIAYFKPLEPGDMTVWDCGAKYRGYWCDMVRVASVGEPTDKQRQYYDIVVEAQTAGIQAVRPGATAADVFHAVAEVFGRSRQALKLSMCGHGIGLDLHEPPTLCSEDNTVLEPGMIVTVEPWIHDWDGAGVLAVEDLVVVTEEGHRVLSDSLPRRELWVVR